MRGAALRRRRRVVDGRTNERVAKVDVAVGERDEPGVLPGLEGVVLEAERVEGRPDRLHLVRQRNRRDDERPPRVLREPLRTPGEGPLERRPGRHRIGQSLPSCELLGGEDAAELDERERVPLGGLAQPPRHIGCDGPSLVAGQDECGVLGAERRQLQLLERRRVERALAAFAHGEQDRDGVGDEALRREEQRIVGREIDPVGVVHEDQQRVGLRGRGDQAQRRRADREAVVRLRLGDAERALQRISLLRRDLRQVLEQRPHELEEARELELDLVLDADRATTVIPSARSAA